MKLILLVFLFYNSVASSTPATPGPGWIGCVFTPDAPCSYTRTMTCKALATKEDSANPDINKLATSDKSFATLVAADFDEDA